MDILSVLLEITIYSAVIFFVLMCIKKVFHKQMSPLLHYAVWALLIFRLMMPMTIDSSLRLVVIPTGAAAQQTAQVAEQSLADTNDAVPNNTVSAVDEMQASQPVPESAAKTQTAADIAATTGRTAAVHLGITDLLLIVWLAGILIALVYIAAAYVVTKKRIQRSGVPVPMHVVQLFDTCKRELGIRGRLKIVYADGVASPALFFPRTVLMPVDALQSMSDIQIRFALRHELTHYRRRDHVVSFALVLLQAVHWFNPFVWLAFRQIRLDMEVACDNSVVGAMDGADKMAYASTVLSMFSGQKRFAAMLGMAMVNTKTTAEKRIRGIFARRRSSRKARMSAVLMAAVLLLTCFTTACQPTPEAPIVQSKDNDSVAQAIEDSADAPEEIHTFTAPDTWQTQTHDDVKNIDIYVDAAVDVPTDTWGIYQLVPRMMTEADFNTILTAVVGNATIYGEQTLQSKEYLLGQITHLEAQKKEFERLLNEGGLSEDEQLAAEAAGLQPVPESDQGRPGGSISSLSDEDLKRNIANFTQMIYEAKAALPTAPDEETVVQHAFNMADMFNDDITAEQALQSGFSYHQDGNTIAMSLNGTVDVGNENPADIYFHLNRGDNNGFNLNYTGYDDYELGFFDGEPYTGQELFKCDISVEDAAQIARDKVAEMGFGYLDIDTTDVCAMLDRQRKEGDKFPECFEFVFTRAMDGATATNAHGDGMWTEEKELALQYAPYWNVGEVAVNVDDSGVIGIRIGAPKSDVVRQAYGIELKDIDAIMEIFTTQLAIENAFMYDSYPENATRREVHIDEIRLGYMPTAWKDHSGELIFTPVWDFFGYEVVTYEEGTGEGGDFAQALDDNNQRTYDLGEQSLLTINAMDGTIMLRE